MNETLLKQQAENAARAVWAAFGEKKGEDISVLEVGGVSALADYFVIATSKNKAQTDAMAFLCVENAEKAGLKLIHAEGRDAHGWTLLDFGCVMAHIFGARERAFYDLERLWADAKRVAF